MFVNQQDPDREGGGGHSIHAVSVLVFQCAAFSPGPDAFSLDSGLATPL